MAAQACAFSTTFLVTLKTLILPLNCIPEAYDFSAYLQQIVHDFSAEAYVVDVKLNEKTAVHKAFVRFRGLLHELGLSGYAEEVLAIKIEVDTNPPLHGA